MLSDTCTVFLLADYMREIILYILDTFTVLFIVDAERCINLAQEFSEINLFRLIM